MRRFSDGDVIEVGDMSGLAEGSMDTCVLFYDGSTFVLSDLVELENVQVGDRLTFTKRRSITLLECKYIIIPFA